MILQQAQTYFAGQSRYVGVYDTSRLAARAYVVVQDFLRQYRDDHTITKESPKEELAIIFANARRAADDAVRELKDSLKSNELTTLTTTASTASTVVAPAPTPHPAIAPLADAVVPASSPSQPLNITTI